MPRQRVSPRIKRGPITLLVVLALCGIGIVLGLMPRARLLPAGAGLPDREIVFFPGPDTLGFVNSDGSGYETRTVSLSRGLLNELFRTAPVLAWSATWSPDGHYLAARMSVHERGGGVPMLISSDGDFLSCPVDTPPIIYGKGRSWLLSGTTLLTVAQGTDANPDRVIKLDMGACTETATLYVGMREEVVSEATQSREGRLAIASWSEETGYQVTVLNPDLTLGAVLPGGVWPAWSRDSEWLAYVVFDEGLYVVRKTGEARRLLRGPSVGMPSWSPDGQWLVYDRASSGVFGIYKISVATGEEFEIFRGGAYPNWR